MSSSLDPDHAHLNCLQRLSADDTSKQIVYDDNSSKLRELTRNGESGIYIKLQEHLKIFR